MVNRHHRVRMVSNRAVDTVSNKVGDTASSKVRIHNPQRVELHHPLLPYNNLLPRSHQVDPPHQPVGRLQRPLSQRTICLFRSRICDYFTHPLLPKSIVCVSVSLDLSIDESRNSRYRTVLQDARIN